MINLQKLSIVLIVFFLWKCSSQNQEEVDTAAQKLFEQNIKELKMLADEACLEKRATYIMMYKDSLLQINKLIGDE